MIDRRDTYIGIDLGGTSVRAVVAREDEILGADDGKTHADEGFDAVLERIEKVVRRAADRAGVDVDDCAAVGIGVPGAVDRATGLVRRAPNLDWTDRPLGRKLGKRLGLRVTVDNDVDVGLLGEHVYGAGRGCLHVAAVFVGTGVGGGLIVNGAPHVGGRGAAGEIGHMVVHPHGRRCGCGRDGCVEAYASKTAMEAMVREQVEAGRSSVVFDLMQEKGKTQISSSVIEKALQQDDRPMAEAVETAQYYLGLLTANLVNAFDPEVVVFGGGVVERLGAPFLEPIAATAREHYLRQEGAERIRILPAALGDDAGALGATIAARRAPA